MSRRRSSYIVHDGPAEIQCCAELYGCYSGSHAFQTELRSCGYGIMSLRKSQAVIAHLQCI